MLKRRNDIGNDCGLQHYALYKEQIVADQVRQMYKLAPLGMIATVVNALLVFLVMKDVLHRFLILWLVAILVVTLLRGSLGSQYAKRQPEAAEARLWANRFLIGLLASGTAWGTIGLFPFDGISMAHQVFLAFVLGGMAAGASSTFASVKRGFLAFAVPALLPLALHFIMIQETFHYLMAAMTVLFGFLLWRISFHNYSVNRNSLLLRYENREMIETLKQAKERVEGLNSQLMEEIAARLEAEAGLRANQEQLEKLVAVRTADLLSSNEQLKTEIEERKQYEQALLQTGERLAVAQRQSEAASRAKTEFLANMSHEMRTPLAGALGMIKLVLDMDIGAEERQLLEMAKRSSDSLLRIIADVLDFSRLEAGAMMFEHKPFSLREVVRSALEVVSLVAKEKALQLSWNVDAEVCEQLTGDEGRLRQVLVNLLGNAVKFTERGGIEVDVSNLDPHDSQGERFIHFSVRDTGVGIDADQMEWIFDRFTQVDSSLTRRHGGTGLGLALTRQIVEKMGGRIWAESVVGAGSTFHFTVPVVSNAVNGPEPGRGAGSGD
jgi:signal transduction histidine kinase